MPEPEQGAGAEERLGLVAAFFEGTAASYDRVVALTTFGLDRVWKRALLRCVPRGARTVLDLACGTGIVTKALLQRRPRARVTGVDVTAEYLAVARRRFARLGDRVTLRLGNAEDVLLDGPYDAVVASYLPKYVDAGRLVANLLPHLAPGAVVAFHDFTVPGSPLPRALWTAWMRVVARVGPWAFPEWRVAFDRRLEALVRTSRWPEDLHAALAAAAFDDVRTTSLVLGTGGLVSGRARGQSRT